MKLKFLITLFLWAVVSIQAQQVNKLSFGDNACVRNDTYTIFNCEGDFTIEVVFSASQSHGNIIGNIKRISSAERNAIPGYVSNYKGFYIHLKNGDGKPRLNVHEDHFVDCDACPDLRNAGPTDLAITKQGIEYKIYINGVFMQTVTLSGYLYPNAFNTNLMMIGNDSYDNLPFRGDIYMARIWNVKRTDTEIAQTYNTCVSESSSSLVGYYRMDKGSGLTLENHVSSYRNYPLTLGSNGSQTIVVPNALPVWGTAAANTRYTPGPIIDVPASATSCIPGSIITLNATASGLNGPLTWASASNPALQQGYTLTVAPTQTTAYTVTGANNLGCSSSMPVSVNVTSCEATTTTKALSFDGVEDYVEVPGYTAVNNIGGGDFTIEARIKAIGNGRRYPAIVSNRANGTGFLMFLGDDKPNYNGEPWFNIEGINYICGSCPSLLDNTPHMLSVSRTAGTLYMYIDGVLKYSHVSYAGGTNMSSTGNIRIGNDAANMPNTYFRGDISEVRVWNYARSASQILSNINKSISGSSTGLQGYWRLNEGSGQTAYNNAFGNNIHGALGASTTVQSIDPIWVNSTVTIPKAVGSSFENAYNLGILSSGFNLEHTRNNTDNNLDDDTRQVGNDIVYSFTLSQTSLVTVSLCNSSLSDSYLSLFNANRKLVKENDDYGYQYSCAGSAQAAVKMNLIAGTYYVVSEAYNTTYTGNISTKITVAAFDAAFGTAEGARVENTEVSQKDQASSAEEIHAYPNPVKDGILFFGRNTTEYSLLNAHGEVMLKGKNAENINVENLPAGLYILKTDGKTEKIVIE